MTGTLMAQPARKKKTAADEADNPENPPIRLSERAGFVLRSIGLHMKKRPWQVFDEFCLARLEHELAKLNTGADHPRKE